MNADWSASIEVVGGWTAAVTGKTPETDVEDVLVGVGAEDNDAAAEALVAADV